MTKKKFSYYFDKLFWYGVAVLPILFVLIFAVSHTGFNSFGDMLTQFVAQFPSGDVVSNVFVEIWQGLAGLSEFALGANFPSVLIYLCTYLVYAEILHLLVDFLLFIPNLAHKCLNWFTKD